MVFRACLLASVLLLPAPVLPDTAAGDAFKESLAFAKTFREKKDIRGALGWIGRAVAAAHAAGDLLGEQEAMAVLSDITSQLDQREPRPGAPPTEAKGPPDHREAMVLLMETLDPDRAGAFVSAPSLAREVLLFSTEFTGGGAGELTIEVINGWSATPKAGAAARFLQVWSTNLSRVPFLKVQSLRKDMLEEVDRQLEIGAAEGWASEVTHMATEVAQIYGVDRLPKEGMKRMEIGLRACLAARDSVVVARWQRAVDATLNGVLEPLGEPLLRVIGKFAPIPAGPGGDAREPSPTGLGLAFPAMKAQAPLVTVTRKGGGFEATPAWGSRVAVVQPCGPGVRYMDLGGIILFFSGMGVGLHAVDLEGRVAKPGDGYPDISLRALHLLARGETWTLRKDGTVTISK